MRIQELDKLRNVALIGHGQAGKSTLAEAALHAGGVTDRMGSVEAGTSVPDSDADEIERKISISLALLPMVWEGHKLNLLDTPGYADFAGEVACAFRVADGILVVVDATSGVEVQTERYATMAAERGLPRMVAITKLDKEHADFARTLAEVHSRLGVNAVAVSIPIGSQTGLTGVVDLVKEVAYTAAEGKESRGEIPEAMAGVVAEYREKLIEAAAEADDELMEKYLEEETLAPGEIVRGLRSATLAGKVVPVAATAPPQMIGVRALLDTIIADMPSPAEVGGVRGVSARTGEDEAREAKAEAPLSAVVFKTTADPYAGRLTHFRVYSGTVHSDSSVYNATREERERIGPLLAAVGKKHEGVPSVAAGDIGLVAKLHATLTGDTLCEESRAVVLPGIDFPTSVFSLAIAAKSRADEDKVGAALARVSEEDPTILYSINVDTQETILSGLGDLQLEIAVSKLRRKYGVQVETGAPKIPYKETIRGSARVQGRFKRQTGGRGQFGDVWVRFEPRPRGAGFEFANEVKGGSVPRNFVPAVERGIQEAMARGVLAGYPLTDIRAALDDGSSHSVDSSDFAFKVAGSIALQKGVQEAGAMLLEPVVEVQVVVPAEQMGDVIGVLNVKRGSILGMEPSGNSQVVSAQAPLAELSTFASELRSITGGRGSYNMQFSHYQEVPAHIVQVVVAAAKQEKEQQSEGR